MSRKRLFAAIPLLALASLSYAQPPTEWTEARILESVSVVRAGKVLTPSSWPGGARVAVCLSFDVDNETLMLRRGVTAPVDLSAGEHGALAGLRRVLELLDSRSIPASFYIPAVSAMLHPDMVERIQRRGRHEIGLHGWIHEDLLEIDDPAEEKRLLEKSRDYLASLSGERPVGFRAPSWVFSEHTLGLLLEAGFLYESSMMARDEPYELLHRGEPTGLVELPVDCSWPVDGGRQCCVGTDRLSSQATPPKAIPRTSRSVSAS